MTRTRTRSRLWAVVPLAVLVFAGWQTVATLSRTPAFNRSLQVEAASGGKVPPLLEANFDRADYYHWISLGWRNRTGLEKTQREETTPFQVEETLERNLLVRDLAAEALRHNPADARTWMLLAKSETELGDHEAALKAWQASNLSAPHDGALSYERLLFLVQFMTGPTRWDLALSTIAPEMVQEDLNAVKSHHIFQKAGDSFFASPALIAFVGDTTGEGVVAGD